FPETARANRAIFYREGRPASVAEVYANLTRSGGPGQAVDPDGRWAGEGGGFMQYASARRADHRREQDVLVAMILRGSRSTDGAGSAPRLTGSMFTIEMLRVLSEVSEKS